MFRRYAAVLLILAVIPPLISIPLGESQSFATITNLSTVTTQATFTLASQYAITTTTATSTIIETIYDSQFVQKGTSFRYCEIAAPIPFNAKAGEQIQGKIASSVPNSLAVYVLSDLFFKLWYYEKGALCEPGTSFVSRYRVTSFALDWTVPEDGAYWLVIETFSSGGCTVTASIAKQYSSAVVLTSYSTKSSLLQITATETATSLSTLELGTPSSIQGNTLTFAGLGVMIIVALAAAYFVLSKGKRKKV